MNLKRKIKIFSDGGSRGNPGPSAAGFVVEDLAGKKRFLCGKYLGVTTNNQAEYQAVILALKFLMENGIKAERIEVYVDSKLVASQLSGLFKVKNSEIRKRISEIRELESLLGEVYYIHIPRSDNAEADRIVNKVLDEGKDFNQIRQL